MKLRPLGICHFVVLAAVAFDHQASTMAREVHDIGDERHLSTKASLGKGLAKQSPHGFLGRTAARIVSGPTLLTGIARCGCQDCGGAMTIRTGKSGQYRYCACSRRATGGETACAGRSIRMEKLDGIVLDALEQKVLSPNRLSELLSAFLEKSDESNQRSPEELALLRTAKTNSEGALNRLYELVEQGPRGAQ